MKNHKIELVIFLTFAFLLNTASCNQITAIPTKTVSQNATLTTTAEQTVKLTPTETPFVTLTPTETPTAKFVPTATQTPTIQPRDFERQVTVGDQKRSYLLHIPPDLDSQQPVPLVFVFHGYTMTPSRIQLYSRYNDIADVDHFIVVYPEGFEKSWNAGGCCGDAMMENVDDPAFIREILSDLETIASIDTKRVYATGFSNGAALSYRLACEMSEIFAAIAPVSGSMHISPCQPQQPVSLMHIHGLDDVWVPYSGGGPYDTPPVKQGTDAWVQLNDCNSPAEVEKLNETSPITHTVYTSCQAGTAVELYTIESGTHTWPSEYIWPASEIIWDFFVGHPKPEEESSFRLQHSVTPTPTNAPKSTLTPNSTQTETAEISDTTTKVHLSVATVSMSAVTDTEANLQTFFSYMEEAAEQGAHLIVFPEIALQQNPAWGRANYQPTQDELDYLLNTAETIPGESTSRVVEKAKELHLYVIFGMTEKVIGEDALYSVSVFVGPDGIIGKYRKINLWKYSSGGNEHLYWKAGEELGVYDSPIGRVGLMICWDMHFLVGLKLSDKGADLLVTVAGWKAFGGEGYENDTKVNARRANLWHVISNQVGSAGHLPDYGHSRIVDPNGDVVVDTGPEEGMVIVKTDLLIDVIAEE